MTRKSGSGSGIGWPPEGGSTENEYLRRILDRFSAIDELAGPGREPVGDMPLVDFDLRALVDDAMEVLGKRAQDAGLDLVWMVHPDVPSHLRGDAGRLRRVLLALSTHAIRYAEWYQVVLRVSLDRGTATSATIRFRIMDTGADGPRDSLGAPFALAPEHGGTALAPRTTTGLRFAISRQLAGLLGGRIGIESEESRGSTFWFVGQFQRRS
jgi:signal transduction histidine kinase